ncbi:hypothetical protein ABFT80_26940 [Mesorhizobium sp. SB112]|uniref:hypothetical protein n=1 Tax=Mesorhizobium sp. SB112 TaxID=3151853 RepID=UPI003267CD58
MPSPTGPEVADYVQISLGREVEWRAGPIVNPSCRAWSEHELLDPSWIDRDARSDDKVVSGSLYRLPKRASSSVVHVRAFLVRCARLEHEKREERRPELEQRVWDGSDGTQKPFLESQSDWFDLVPRSALLSGLGGGVEGTASRSQHHASNGNR